jgi:hypothetical protein
LCGGLSNCCEANGGLGCDDAECQAAVCAVDPFCCDTAWDGICADEAVSLCGDLCGGGGGCTHTPVECDDDDPCTQDSCDPDTGCVNTPVDCNDEDACTDDSCSAGVGDSDCCVGHRGPGCDDAACEAAVCGADPGCCVGDGNWDVTCAGLAASLCADLCSGAVCMHTPVDCDDGDACTDDGCDPASGCTHTPIRCGDGSTCTEDSCDPDTGCVNTPIDCDDGDACTVDACSPGLSNCCVPNGGLGCDEAGCQATVCATDPFCCDTAWDDVCADEAASLCGDLCDAIVSSTCCVPNGGLGCDDARCQAAVCAIDPFCCDTAWDGICAEEAASLCGDLCRGIVGSSNCCEGHGGLGCDDAACQATVCGVDPFCCDVAWDGICAGEAESLCQELCFGSPGGCTYTPVDCDDDNACTEDSCDSATGCAYTPIECDDGNACTADSCDPDTGCVSTFIDGCVDLDIKPGSCPNAFVRGVVGLLPVSLTGSADFDLALIDQSSLLLSRADGVGGDLAPSGISIRDQATPYAGPLCGCHTLTTDGWVDLNLTFKNAAVTTAFQLNSLSLGQNVTLQVTGTFVDGTPFSASDCIRLQGMISPVVPPHN